MWITVNGVILWSAHGLIFTQPEEVPPRSVAIVLGALVHPSGIPSDTLDDRLYTAMRLYRAGKVKRLLISGGQRPPDYDEVRTMREWLLRYGAQPHDIIEDRGGMRTRDTMTRAARVFHVKSAIICTQAYHLPRSIYLARAVGIDALGVTSDRHFYPKILWFKTRESLARVKAWLEVNGLY